jgi:hypothetical protein
MFRPGLEDGERFVGIKSEGGGGGLLDIYYHRMHQVALHGPRLWMLIFYQDIQYRVVVLLSR